MLQIMSTQRQSKQSLKDILILICLLSFCGCRDSFCSSKCADYIGACFGAESDQCYACQQSIFELNGNNGSCQLISQRNVLFEQLPNSAMDLTGYSTNKPTPIICDQYTFSGQYVSGDYISKTFTNIALNHYEIVVRFGVGFMGTWNANDKIFLMADGTQYSKSYVGCYQPQHLCFTAGNDCIKIMNQKIPHSSNTFTLNITSSISELDPAYQFWGIKDLLIVAKLCHSKCDTCFGPSEGQCITCAFGYFLWGNLCVKECQNLYLPSKRMCVQQCPVSTFQNGNKQCISCEQDCLVCSDVNGCQVWSNKKSGALWQQNKMFWILLIIVSIFTLFYLLWECVIQKYLKKSTNEDIIKSMMTESSLEQAKEKENSKQSNSSDPKQKDKVFPQHKLEIDGMQYFNTKNVVFEQSGLNWTSEIPTVQQIMVTNEQTNQRRKKKRARQAGNSQSFQITGIAENMTLYSNTTVNN